MHSLGNYVLQNALESSWSTADVDAFANLVLLAPDVDGVGHAAWLTRAGKQTPPNEGTARIVVTVNQNDWVLAASNLFNGKQRLGTYGLGRQLLTNESYNALYLDVTTATRQPAGHSYFVDAKSLGKANKRSRLYKVMALALCGKPLPAVNNEAAAELYEGGIYASPPIAAVEKVPINNDAALADWP